MRLQFELLILGGGTYELEGEFDDYFYGTDRLEWEELEEECDHHEQEEQGPFWERASFWDMMWDTP